MCNLHYHVYQNTIFIPEVSTAMVLPARQEPGQVLLPPLLGVEGHLYTFVSYFLVWVLIDEELNSFWYVTLYFNQV